jgi:hypothetical protein
MNKDSHPLFVSRLIAYAGAGLIAAGMLCSGRAQAQSAITGLYPNGTNMFQPSSTLSFTASSPVGVTNVTVHLTVTSLYTGQSFIRNLSSQSGLIITGPNTAQNVSANLNSNTLYSATIQVQDANGNTANQTVSFDTITPSYTWEAEDWNYTSNGTSGLFIDNPQTNAYAGLDTSDGVDAHNSNGNTSTYRPGNADNGHGGLYTENIGSPESNYRRLQYIGTGKQDYDVGFTDNGDFGNYTRTYPAGTYNIFVRAAGGNGAKSESADISVISGNATISSPANAPYKFGVKGNGWQSYDFMPVTDSGGNLVQITFDGTPSTLQVLQAGQASDNMNFFMLVPTNANNTASTVTISNVVPDGSMLFNTNSTFSFNAWSPSLAVDPNNIIVQVTATNVWQHGSVSSLSASSGLTITGPSTNLNVSFPITTNTMYSVFIQITDGNGNPMSATYTFDTIVPTYTFEAEDFDYGNGQFFDNPQTNAYRNLDGVLDSDYHLVTQHGGDYLRVGLTTESLSEKLRPQYNGTGMQDYDVGFNDGGNWGNYTRNYPSGTYNIYVRASNGTGNHTADSGSISLVTSGLGTTTQTTVPIGKFSVPPIAWSTYSWVPVKDPVGNLAQFTGGSLETLRMTIDGGNCNENFFLLVPADPSTVLQPFVDTFTPDGSAIFQPSNTVSFIVHSQPGMPTGNIQLTLNGVAVSGLTFSGTANLRTVSYGIKPNAFYTAVVTATDANGTARITNSFATFASTNYQFEAEDYDYNGGQFFDNPQVGSYNGLGSVAGIDNIQADLGANPFNFRVNAAPNYAPSTTPSGDAARDQFAGGATDYNIGFFGHNSWANYTRHYPAGTYMIVGRFAEGNNATEDTMALVASGQGTSNQVTTALGTFAIPAKGWGTWEWAPLTDGSGKPVKVTLDGSQTTLQLGGSPIQGHDEANVNFFMLVAVTPSPILKASVSSGSIHISFPTQNGYTYQVQGNTDIAGPNWVSVGTAVTGNGSVQSVDDSVAGVRFYRVQVQ